ncbi:unnamed protein product, partial [Ixodes persulcatus]
MSFAGVPRMVCTIRYVSAGTLPEHVAPCDYLVYTGITHEGQNGTLVLQDDDDFGTFLALGGGFKPKLAVELKLAQLLDPEANSSMEAAISTTRFWLSKQRINAVALFVDQDHYSESGQPKLLALVKMLRGSLGVNSTSWLLMDLIVGVPPSRKDSSADLLPYVDVLIYLMHHISPNQRCRVVFPSTGRNGEKFSQHVRVFFFFFFNEVIKGYFLFPQELQNKNKKHTICVSVSLAVLEFSSFGKPLKVGDACDAENWKPYSETCPKAKLLTMCDAEAMSDIEQDGGYTRTFETEDSLHLKVTKIQAALGARSCVAAFHLEYEDGGHSCRSRKAFSRVAAIAAAFDTGKKNFRRSMFAKTLRKILPLGSIFNIASSSLAIIPIAGLLICVWSAVPPVPMKLSKGICNIMVYKHVQYNRTTDTVYLRNDDLFEDFSALAKADPSLRLFVAFDYTSFEDPWFREGSFSKRFSAAAVAWVEAKGVHGIAFFPQNFGFLLRVLPVLQALSNGTRARPAVILGMPVTDDPHTLEQHVDIIVFMTHHPEKSKPCALTFPSSLVRRIHSSALLKRLSVLSGALLERYGHLHSVCYATNLAVLQFRLKPQQSELDDNCLSEEWLTYSEV